MKPLLATLAKAPRTTESTSATSSPTRSNILELPRELQEHILSFLPLNSLLTSVRLVDKYLKASTERWINEQKISINILEKPKIGHGQPATRQPVPPGSLYKTFKDLKITFFLAEPAGTNQRGRMHLTFDNLPDKNLKLTIYAYKLAPEKPCTTLTPAPNYWRYLNIQPHITNLIFDNYLLGAPLKHLDFNLNFPKLKFLDLTLDDFAKLKNLTPPTNLETLHVTADTDLEYVDLATILPLTPKLQNLALSFLSARENYPHLSNLPSLHNKDPQLKFLLLNHMHINEENLSFADFANLTDLSLINMQIPNLQTLHLPPSLTELDIHHLSPKQLTKLWDNLPKMCPRLQTVGLKHIEHLDTLTSSHLTALTELKRITFWSLNFSDEQRKSIQATMQARFTSVKIKVTTCCLSLER